MLQFFQKYKNVFFVLGLICAISLFSYTLLQRDFWYDEAYSGIAIRLPWQELWNKVIHDVHPPLYYTLLKIWSILFGSNALALRSFSLFFHILSLYIFFRISSFYSNKVAYVSTALFALSPFFLGYATEARMYTLLCFFVLAGGFSLLKFQNQQKKYIYLIFSGIFFALGSLTHYFGLLGFISAFFFIAFENRHRLMTRQAIFTGLCLLLPFLLLFTPWIPYLFGQLGRLSSFGWIPQADINHFPETLAIFFYGNSLGTIKESLLHNFFLFLPPIVLFTLLVYSITKMRMEKEKYISFLISFACIPFLLIYIASFFGTNLYLERYFLPYGAFLTLLSILSFYRTLHKVLFSALVLSYFISIMWFYSLIPLHKDYALLSSEIKNIPTLVLNNPFDYTVAKFYYPEKNILLASPEDDYSEWNIIDSKDIIKTFPEEQNTVFLSRKNNSDAHGKEIGDFIIEIK